MNRHLRMPPKDWGKDSLTAFFDQARDNQWVTFENLQDATKALKFLDSCFTKASEEWIDPKENVGACQLFLRSHYAFKTAAGLSLAGQIAETTPILRVCLEYAASALRIERNVELALVFLNRHDDDLTLKASRKEFSSCALARQVRDENQALGADYSRLYGGLIDLGGHPNERALSINSAQHKIDGDGHSLVQIGLHADARYIGHALMQSLEVGICSLKIAEAVFSERFEKLGVSELLANGFANSDVNTDHN